MAGLISTFVGHGEQKSWLLNQSRQGELPSSIILQGPQGVGKKTLIRALLQVLNCSNSEMACGECSNCRRSLEDSNELVHLIQPESKKSIGVDQVREAHRFLFLRSMHPARFILIDPADKLTLQASNSLLKVLEEAPPQTHFFLVTEQIRSLLPTIRSRSHILKFNPLRQEELKSFKDFDELALQWSNGRLQMALELQDPETIDRLNESLQFFYSLLCEAPQDWKKKYPWFFNDDQSRDFSFNIWKQALQKRLYGQDENLAWLPQGTGPLSRLYEQVEFLKRDIASHVDKLLALENFYYRLKNVEVANERIAP